MTVRHDGRKWDEARPIHFNRNFLKGPQGSVLAEAGNTRVICTATVEEYLPHFLKDQKGGWITAEYGMLPGSTDHRTPRESMRGRPQGRTQEIQRLIGRSLRAACDLDLLGPRTIIIDCDVIQADGGTRTLAISGGWVALHDAVNFLVHTRTIERSCIINQIAAISCGIVREQMLLDLNYEDDFRASVDANVVMTNAGELIELQCTAELRPFTVDELSQMLEVAARAIQKICQVQTDVLSSTQSSP
jgi:ribonuclease PH